jgi:hypothetical protein
MSTVSPEPQLQICPRRRAAATSQIFTSALRYVLCPRISRPSPRR